MEEGGRDEGGKEGGREGGEGGGGGSKEGFNKKKSGDSTAVGRNTRRIIVNVVNVCASGSCMRTG